MYNITLYMNYIVLCIQVACAYIVSLQIGMFTLSERCILMRDLYQQTCDTKLTFLEFFFLKVPLDGFATILSYVYPVYEILF